MKRKLILALIAMTLVMSGCGKDVSAPDEGSSVFEKIDQSEGSNQEAGQNSNADAVGSADANAAGNANANADGADSTNQTSAETDDYTEQIKSEIAALASDSLTDELVAVNKLYDKYADMTANASNQAEMNCLCQWETLVWEDEVTSLLDRLKEKDSDFYNNIYSEYENWLKYVPSMAEKMTYVYEGGSIYPTMYSYNEAMRFKREAYDLASTLADVTGDVAFSFPDNSPCGYYGDYAGDSYLLITEGMEGGSYAIKIHFDNSKELIGYGSTEDAPESEYISFVSDDGSVEGRIDCFALGASFYASVSDGAVVNTNETYEFSFKY